MFFKKLYNSLVAIFKREKKNENKNYIKVAENGSLYIELSDLIKQEEFKNTIQKLLKSDLIKQINIHQTGLQTQ